MKGDVITFILRMGKLGSEVTKGQKTREEKKQVLISGL